MLPESIAKFTGSPWTVTLPTFLALFLAMVFGVLVGLVWEWLREGHLRAESRTRAHNLALLQREYELWRSDHRPRALVYIEAIEAGSTLIEISSRFSLSAKSIESALYRAGRADLVQRARVARVSRGNQYGRWSA